MRFRVSSRSLAISVEWSRHCSRVVVNSPAVGSVSAVAVRSTSCTVEIVSVVERSTPGVVPVAAIDWISAMPIESPMRPAPPITAEPANSKSKSERKVRPTKPDARVRVPSGPGIDWSSVNQPRVICGNVNNIGSSRLNDDSRALRGHSLLRGGFQIAGIFCPLAHHLNGIHYFLLLFVVSVASDDVQERFLSIFPRTLGNAVSALTLGSQ